MKQIHSALPSVIIIVKVAVALTCTNNFLYAPLALLRELRDFLHLYQTAS